jgi:hypothetical protein
MQRTATVELHNCLKKGRSPSSKINTYEFLDNVYFLSPEPDRQPDYAMAEGDKLSGAPSGVPVAAEKVPGQAHLGQELLGLVSSDTITDEMIKEYIEEPRGQADRR